MVGQAPFARWAAGGCGGKGTGLGIVSRLVLVQGGLASCSRACQTHFGSVHLGFLPLWAFAFSVELVVGGANGAQNRPLAYPCAGFGRAVPIALLSGPPSI